MTDLAEVDYLEESGPGITELPAAGAVPQPSPLGGEPPPQYPGWEQETIETFLQGFGSGVHMLIGQSEKDWMMTKKDLERIAPPLTRIANRWEPALRLSPVADPLLVAHGFALYGWRSALERQRALRDQEELVEPGPGYEPAGEPSTNGAGPAVEHQAEDVDLSELNDEPYFP
jgi:hypothetical protein